MGRYPFGLTQAQSITGLGPAAKTILAVSHSPRGTIGGDLRLACMS
jgi:hypothetical protein